MRVLLVACLFAVACKSESSTSTPTATEKPTPTEVAKPERNRDRPHLPDQPGSEDGRMRPRLPEGAEPRDWNDPEVREQMRAVREERRAKREAMLDTNHDGVISDAERVMRMEPMKNRLDTNGDGKLTPDELSSSDRRMGFDDPAALDENHDGEISLGELDKAVTARREQMRSRWRGRGGGSANVPAAGSDE